ncbi:sensor histidine kinase [Anaeromyxobacter sp. SG26]|uniref:sensor histidine kinase n=1 Tax=Anaeromyxobacter sp. SG26 TaxID=2925407 RepID=UPI001F5700FC|nr:ATP-binding protein [Anaeromyxobacter sp. SG26]
MSLASSQPLSLGAAGRPPERADGTPDAERDGSPPSLGRLLTGDAWVAPEERVQDVAQLFFGRPELEAVALVADERPVGLLTRGRLLVKLARNFGHELYAKKPVTRIADLAPLVLPHDVPLATAVERALERDAASVYDEVIVVDALGRYLGYSSVRELVQEQGAALERTALEREAAVARASDLEKVDELRSRFLAHATHELRSPVNAIVALAELVRMACERENLEQVRAKLPMLLRAAATLRGTVNNILDLSKVEAGRMDVSIGPVDLAELVAEVAATARLLLGEKPVRVEVEAAGAPVVASDAQKVRQILVNLVSNAAKFTDRGAIRVRVGTGEGGGAAVSVADTGCGIAEADLPRLFVPFGQLEDAATKSHPGTGLGLVITRSLAELLGGRVEVASRRGEGSTFTVHLPGTPPPRRAP